MAQPAGRRGVIPESDPADIARLEAQARLRSLTPAGRAIYEDLAPVALAVVERFVQTVDPAEHAIFERELGMLTDRLANLAAEGSERRSTDSEREETP